MALTLLVLLPTLWIVAALAARRLARWRSVASLVLRSLILTALVLAIAGTQLVLPARTLTTIFLLDRSDSMSAAQRQQSETYLATALRSRHPNDRAGVVLFGQNALVERAPVALAALGRLSSAPIGARTNLQEAIQLGLALFPDDTQKRLVLLSDGSANSGVVAEALRLAQVRNVPVDVVSLPGGSGPDVLVTHVDASPTAREGQEIALGVTLQSSFATSGTVQVFVDGQLVSEQQRAIPAGPSALSLRLPAGTAGYRRVEVRVAAAGDSTAQNNRAVALVEVQGPPRILIIASEPQRAAAFRQAILATGAAPEIRTPDQAPADLTQLGAYAGVVLFDTPARALPRALIEALPTYVRELGRGLAMIGGANSFGAGGYRRTPIEPLLPVDLNPKTKNEQSDVALTLVIDRSGSMGDSADNGRTKLDLAKESVYQASLGLSDQDQIGLVVFDEQAQWVLPLQRLPDGAAIERALSQFDTGGGTDIRPGVALAATAMNTAQARIKHIILLTDGIAESNYNDLISQLQAQHVTISTVAIGDDANPNLEDIAKQGGGRFYRVRQANDVPNIFLQETVLIAGRDIVEGQFTPKIALQSPLVRGLAGLPPLRGYNGTESKATARTILVSADDKPVLAQEQIGLGHTLAWTSDFAGRWSADWLGWSDFPRFVSGMIDVLAPPRAAEGLTVRAEIQGEQAVLELEAKDPQGRPLNNLTLDGRLVDPDQHGVALGFVQIGPGRYRAAAPAAATGVYLAQISAADKDGNLLGTVSAGLAVSYSPEYSDQRANPQLLAEIARATGGRVGPQPAQAFEPLAQDVGTVRELGLWLLLLVLLLLPFDIAVRRVFFQASQFPKRAPVAVPSAPAPDPQLARLNAAKQRANRDPAVAPVAAPLTAATPERLAQRPAKRPTPQAQRTATLDDDQFARLLAAKRRARSREDDTK